MFNETPQVRFCMESGRLFMRHGPIDLFVKLEPKNKQEQRQAYKIAADSFEHLLNDLCNELDLLRSPITEKAYSPTGPIAARMFSAAFPFSHDHFVTPMIAVAGSVADYLLDRVVSEIPLKRGFVNNGGDIALTLSDTETLDVGVCSDVSNAKIKANAQICADDNIGGIATSGWKGRSHSLGIADSVTVLARTAASADVAATLIANAVDLPSSPKINRIAANELSPDSDLGRKLVTMDVGVLENSEKLAALENGQNLARTMMQSGLIHSAYLSLQDQSIVVAPEPNTPVYAMPHSNPNINSEVTRPIHA